MWKNFLIIAVLALVVALPFAFRRSEAVVAEPGAPTIIIISPHNEAIRYEFAHAFSRWHKAHYGTGAKVDWRNIGGTTEISRYLQGEYATTAKAWWTSQGKRWPDGGTDAVVASRPPPADRPDLIELYRAMRQIDDPNKVSCSVDLFFGGGSYDHLNAYQRGFAVEPWPPNNPTPLAAEALAMIPDKVAGETWRTPTMFGNAVSTFGIVYNIDRLKDLEITVPPASWDDLADFRYFRQVGVTDPTKSGSIAKAFEMLVHQKMHDAARTELKASGVTDDQVDATIAANEKAIDAYKASKGAGYQRGDVPPELAAYQSAIERGFLDGIALVQSIGANARYFTDSATKVSIDTSVGDAAVGMTIDFYGRFQAQYAKGPPTPTEPNGAERMIFLSPVGGTSVSCDPITLLRGAPNRKIAEHFIEFVLSSEGQRLWTYQPGAIDANHNLIGPERYALRRLPIRRDFYPSTQPAIEAAHVEHKQWAVDDLTDPTIDPYQIAKQFTYYPRWTGEHFGVLRDLTRAMCMDSAEELRDAWVIAHPNGNPDPKVLDAMRKLPIVMLTKKGDSEAKPVELNWKTAPNFTANYDYLEYMRAWTSAFRETYRKAARGG
jgi:iron(III) transport system substrate-binding protein